MPANEPRIRGERVWLRVLEAGDLEPYRAAVERVWLTTEISNERARGAFEKAGFRVDGAIRHHFRRHGRWRDSALMAITREDWEALDRPRSWDLGAITQPEDA